MIRSLKILGLELGPYVEDWGSIDDIKDVLLAKTQLFSGQYTVKLVGADAIFSTSTTSSPFYNRTLQNVPITASTDGNVVFQGLIRNISYDGQQRTISITSENFLSPLTNRVVNLTQNGVNPVVAMLSLIQQVVPASYINADSFYSSATGADNAGATVNLAYTTSNNVTCLSAIQNISELCSVSVYTVQNLLTAKTFVPYAGNNSQLLPVMDNSTVRQWGQRQQAQDNMRNQVTIQYGASSSVTLNNTVSQRLNASTVNYAFATQTGSELAVPDLASAEYFGGLFLERSSNLRDTIDVTCGPEWFYASLGQRVPVTSPNLGITAAPYEIIETHKKIMENGVTLKLASL